VSVHVERCFSMPASGDPYLFVREAEPVSVIRVVRWFVNAATETRSGPGSGPSAATSTGS
jgi:hypothetical protein